MLKVSRSLPGETEELKVRTSEGNIATLIVKRREKSVVDISNDNTRNGSFSESATPTTKAQSTPPTIGYRNVDVDPWNRLQIWTSISDAKEEPKKNWLPVNRSFDNWKPMEKPFEPAATQKSSWLVSDQLENSRGFQSVAADNGSDERIIRYTFLPHESRRIQRTNVGANLLKNRDAKNVPSEVVVRSEISVKPQPSQQSSEPKRSSISLDVDGTPIVHGRRVPDEPIDKIQIWRNARVINNKLVTNVDSSTTERGLLKSGQGFERFFEDVNRRYGKTPENNLNKPKTYRNEVLAAEIYETAEDTYRPSIHKRMLQPEVAAIYPNSRIYSPPDSRKSPISNIKPGSRAPVLQYAHPELGVQPAKIVQNEKKKIDDVTTAPINQQYNNQLIQNQNQNSQNYYYGEHRQKKKYVLNDKSIVDSYTVKNYYPNQHFYGLKRPMSEAPFWVKISENLKTHFTDGVAKVSELTKPVIDPLVEATRKISENLGLSKVRSQDYAQDKIGTVTAGSSVLIPALGLMASGAALGIGAVAVGRYLDVDMLKRSNDETILNTSDDQERTLHIISQLDDNKAPQTYGNSETEANVDGVYILVQNNGIHETDTRRKRNSDNIPVNFREIQRKGADSITEIVEVDLPSKLLDDRINSENNKIHIENEDAFAEAVIHQALNAIVRQSEAIKDDSNGIQMRNRIRSRLRRSLNSVNNDDELNDALQNLEKTEIIDANSGHIPGDWTRTLCAKRIFCDAMVRRGSDAYMFMEKKMSGVLKMIQPDAAIQVSTHFDQVMNAVRRHDCSIFSCSDTRPATVFF
ncbi:PREDICTED: uncharacterized protein LOC105367430 [Ceratosolen solmsi marchali]|uniref:Uncharacterized protein LOC105367430 n=1 Tax=Ceratosolen solmsi marchali TaxID=326594 RepID=A0AAJ6YU78_9HYME|nr:PREDICTED: uncharacterized protein LOC105367430 [Ceratosolen solmsi marchali]